jgi:hypothetical protein
MLSDLGQVSSSPQGSGSSPMKREIRIIEPTSLNKIPFQRYLLNESLPAHSLSLGFPENRI